MKKVLTFVFLASVLMVAGCIGGSNISFKECKLDYNTIEENQMAKLWIEIENKGEIKKDLQVVFVYPEEVNIEKNGNKKDGFNVTVEPNGATSGRVAFDVYGEYIEGQPSSPWEIEVKMFSEKELIDEKELTLTVTQST